ncbi:GIDE domain-containing protein [Streptomyces spiramenti]|uniref:RING-type E3 ubiquitin transferase n=1 Tax=Streptomyces spiramenti TaxID=2720606 RepID=A0ABX1AFN4_9ACTN|nr:GIDE domain-containing protein [Streptomyces spiramenti]NJP65963.1 hypothetical protein [Streptomyces spiramenti]
MIWIGLIAAVAAVVCVFAARSAQGRAKALRRVETFTADEVNQLRTAAGDAAGPGQFRYGVEVVGAAHPAGQALTSQLAQRECVWHRHKVTHKYWETVRDSNGNSKRQERSRVVSEHTSGSEFLVRDRTGEVLVDPGKGVDQPEKILDTFEKGGGRGGGTISFGSFSLPIGSRSGTIGYRYEEWALLPGRTVFVHGEADDSTGRLVVGAPADGGLHLVSTRTQEELLRVEGTKERGFRVGAAVSAVGAVVALLVALLG